jgi:hypothetical protein
MPNEDKRRPVDIIERDLRSFYLSVNVCPTRFIVGNISFANLFIYGPRSFVLDTLDSYSDIPTDTNVPAGELIGNTRRS